MRTKVLFPTFLKPCSPLTGSHARDLAAVHQTITQLDEIYKQVKNSYENYTKKPLELGTKIDKIRKIRKNLETLNDLLARAIVIPAPLSLHYGAFVREGYSKQLDEVRILQDKTQEIVNTLQSKYRNLLKIPSLKIKSNQTLGMHIELSLNYHETILNFNASLQKLSDSEKPDRKLRHKKLPDPAEETDPEGDGAWEQLEIHENQEANYKNIFIHCQTMPNAMRYKTEEISSLDQRIQRAEFEIQALELKIFNFLVDEILKESLQIREVANFIAWIDVSSSVAEISKLNHFTRPSIHQKLEYELVNARHPVVESIQQAKQQGQSFTPNSIRMDPDKNLFLLTGPNMGGKSTFLRQIAINAILAQSGFFIPADFGSIGIVDRIFSRVGAGDDLKNDQSTFMMEMQEASAILHSATNKSLVIIDELGRGTSTMEGLSIAWAVVEYLHDKNQCRTIFATHYHELAQLAESLQRLECYQMQILEDPASGYVFLFFYHFAKLLRCLVVGVFPSCTRW